MRQKPGTRKSHGEKVVKDIRRATRKQYAAEDMIMIMLNGIKGEDCIAELCRRKGIARLGARRQYLPFEPLPTVFSRQKIRSSIPVSMAQIG